MFEINENLVVVHLSETAYIETLLMNGWIPGEVFGNSQCYVRKD